MKKKIIVLITSLILVSLLCTLTGCGNSNKPSDEEFIAEGIKLYEQEFNDEFSFVKEIRGGNGTWGEFGTMEEGMKDIIVTSKKYPDKEITMSFFYNKNTKKYRLGATDYNYIRYKEQINKDLEKISQIYSDYFVRVTGSSELPVNCDYEDYISTSKNNITLSIYVAPSLKYNKNEDVERICNTLKDNKLNIRSIGIYYLKNSELYAKIKDSNESISGGYNKDYEVVSVFLDENYQIRSIHGLN